MQAQVVNTSPALAVPCVLKGEDSRQLVPAIEETFVAEFDHRRDDGVWIIDIKKSGDYTPAEKATMLD